MALDLKEERQIAHALLDQLPPAKLGAVRSLLEVMIDPDDEEFSEEDRRAVAASREYFRQGGEGRSLEQVAADCGFTMEQVRSAAKDAPNR
jgi:hypothetical protein